MPVRRPFWARENRRGAGRRERYFQKRARETRLCLLSQSSRRRNRRAFLLREMQRGVSRIPRAIGSKAQRPATLPPAGDSEGREVELAGQRVLCRLDLFAGEEGRLGAVGCRPAKIQTPQTNPTSDSRSVPRVQALAGTWDSGRNAIENRSCGECGRPPEADTVLARAQRLGRA